MSEVKKRAPRKKPVLTVVEPEVLKIDLPDFNAVGLVRMSHNSYSAVTMQVRGGLTTIVDVGEPNAFGIAVDDMKVSLQKRVLDAITR